VEFLVTPSGTDENTDAPVKADNIVTGTLTITQELKSHLEVMDVWSSLTADTASTEQVFEVMATVHNAGEAVAEDVTAELSITGGAGSAEISGPEPGSEDFVAGSEVVTFTWEVTCTGAGAVELLVTPSGTDENTDAAVLADNIVTGTLTITQEEKVHLVAEITLPRGDEFFRFKEPFTVTALISNTGEADALDVSAMVSIEGPAELKAGEPVSKTLDNIPGRTPADEVSSSEVSWELVCTGDGPVTITVTPAGTDENTSKPVLPANIESDAVTVRQVVVYIPIVAKKSTY
jgi:hypothetical protein